MFETTKYTRFEYEFEGALSSGHNYNYVKLPYERHSGKKILFALDYLPTEDLKEGRLLSGETGKLFVALIEAAQSVELKKKVQFSWMACAFNGLKTAGTSQEFRAAARVAFANRLKALIYRYKPDTVVTFGRAPSEALIGGNIALSDGKQSSWFGVPVKCVLDDLQFVTVSTVGLEQLLEGSASTTGMIGVVVRNLANALTSEHRWAVNNNQLLGSKAVLVDTFDKFTKLMDYVSKKPVVAIDTETANLNRIKNTLLTVQFATNTEVGYVLPIYHKDTPFTPKELLKIRSRLRSFFEGDNDNQYHVYVNAVFDFNVLRNQLPTRYMHNACFDILAGEFVIDEGYKGQSAVTGDYYYSLANISCQYGFTGYMESRFSKKDRKNIATTDLNGDFLKYCAFDVTVPFAIHLRQIERGRALGHAKYESVVKEQISDTLHMFSRMESNGSGLDVDYLFYLRTPGSPIEQTIKKMEHELLSTPEVKEANKRLLKQKGVPTNGLFGSAEVNLFSLRKDDHKQLLFFDVCELEPLGHGTSGKGKLDAVFQKTYADNPIVAAYTALGKANKLKNAYVRSFIKLLGESPDLKHDHRIRPSYNYLMVVTGRTSASDPNLQQIPSHSELGKQIKRLFVSRAGRLYIKVDYKVHEVRGWGIISFDLELAKIFKRARELKNKYRQHPTPALLTQLEFEADVHVVNAMYFFSKTLADFVADKDLKKALRNAVKAVIFGLIYQMSIKSLARTINKPVEYAKELVANFRKRFPRGMKWIEDVKVKAAENWWVENPLGLRRHLWGYLLDKDSQIGNKVHAEMQRRAVNSPIQGMGAQFMAIGARYLDKMIHAFEVKHGREVDYAVCNSVHDSLENEFAYRDFMLGLNFVEYALIDGVRKTVKSRHNMDLVVDVDIDVEIGASLSNCGAWDDSLCELERLVYASLVFQRDELGHPIVVSSAMKEVFVEGWPDSPKWLKEQAINTNWSFDYDKYKLLDPKS